MSEELFFKKICYILARLGVDTGFFFSKGSNGPYSNDIKKATAALKRLTLCVQHKKPLWQIKLSNELASQFKRSQFCF